MINKLLIVGCGLIGSSILKKVCKKKIAKKIFVFEKSKKNQRTLKRFKLKFQLIKKMDKKISECDFIVICAPLSEYKKIFLACNKYSKNKDSFFVLPFLSYRDAIRLLISSRTLL